MQYRNDFQSHCAYKSQTLSKVSVQLVRSRATNLCNVFEICRTVYIRLEYQSLLVSSTTSVKQLRLVKAKFNRMSRTALVMSDRSCCDRCCAPCLLQRNSASGTWLAIGTCRECACSLIINDEFASHSSLWRSFFCFWNWCLLFLDALKPASSSVTLKRVARAFWWYNFKFHTIFYYRYGCY